jgi:ATP-binding cassette, subfamily B, bacterial CvaB/MchF/RaxB
MPVILQTEAAECSLACLAMVAAYHGHQVDLPILRARFSVSTKGANLAQLMQTAGMLQLSARPLKIRLKHLSQLQCPAILHWDMNHFVVLKEVKGDNMIIHDPAIGLRKLKLKEASPHFTGIGVDPI